MDNAAGSDQVWIGLMRLVLVILFTVTLSTMALFMVILLWREIALYFQKRKHIKRAVVDGYDSSRISAENQRNHPGQMIDIHENYANDDKQDGPGKQHLQTMWFSKTHYCGIMISMAFVFVYFLRHEIQEMIENFLDLSIPNFIAFFKMKEIYAYNETVKKLLFKDILYIQNWWNWH